jgi:hypothetical protein
LVNNLLQVNNYAPECLPNVLKLSFFHPLCVYAERVAHPPAGGVGGVSQNAMHQRQCIYVDAARIFTHPVFASLDLPSLSLRDKEG